MIKDKALEKSYLKMELGLEISKTINPMAMEYGRLTMAKN